MSCFMLLLRMTCSSTLNVTAKLRYIDDTHRAVMYNSSHSGYTYVMKMSNACDKETKIRTSPCKNAPPFCPNYDCVDPYVLPLPEVLTWNISVVWQL